MHNIMLRVKSTISLIRYDSTGQPCVFVTVIGVPGAGLGGAGVPLGTGQVLPGGVGGVGGYGGKCFTETMQTFHVTT